MTLIKFDYSDSYAGGTRGSLAFMPHRRHAANETEVLPKPFTVPLLNGTVTVDLKPNASSWVWIVTEYLNDVSTSRYYTIPDRDGVMPANELIEIAPSSLPAAYDAQEPVWWTEMRQYKQTTGETLTKATDAVIVAEEAIETGRQSVEQTRSNASLAKAYSETSRAHSYDAKEYRDSAEQWRNEAQEQADRAATGPESAAARSEAAATRSETARDRAITAEDESRVNAAEARGDATTAQNASSTAVTARVEATSQADRATAEANRAQGYANDLLAGPSADADRAEQARDDAQGYATQAQSAADSAASTASDILGHASAAQAAASAAEDAAENAQTAVDSLSTPWQTIQLLNGWQNYSSIQPEPMSYAEQPHGYILRGTLRNGTVGETMFQLPSNISKNQKHLAIVNNNGRTGAITVNADGNVRVNTEDNTALFVSLNGIFVAKA